MKSKAAAILVGIFLATTYTGIVYSLGSSKGEASVKAEWAAENKKRDAATDELQATIEHLKGVHETQSKFIAQEIQSYETKLKNTVAAVHRDYAQRMQHSQNRERIYFDLASGEAAQRERLASHAAQLDRSLVEGRQVVGELRATLEFRDEQLRQLGAQIKADRALLN